MRSYYDNCGVAELNAVSNYSDIWMLPCAIQQPLQSYMQFRCENKMQKAALLMHATLIIEVRDHST